MIDNENTTVEPLVRWITFLLGDESYGIEVEHAQEILHVNNIFPVPGSPQCVLGVTNIRGNIITIIDGRRRLNLPERAYDDDTRMIILESGNEVAGIVVDKVSDVVDLPVSAINPSPKLNDHRNSKYINGVVANKDGLTIILKIDEIFAIDASNMAAGF